MIILKKNIIGIFIILFFLLLLPTPALANPTDEIVKQQIEELDTEEVEEYWNKLMDEYGGFFPDNQKSLFDLVVPGEKLQIDSIFVGLLKYFFYEIVYNAKLIGTIILLTVFSTILHNIQTSFEQSTVSKVAFYITYLVLIIIAINSFSVAISLAQDAIQQMVNFMIALLPILLTLLATSGSLISASLFHPLIIFLINVIGTIIYKVIFPLIFFSSILYIVSAISDKYKVTQLAKLLRNVSVGLLGTLLTIFLGVISVQGASASVADGVTLKTAKYITGNFIPVVGRMFSDAADTVLGASLLVKNAVGMAGVILLFLIVVFPAIKILVLAFIYSFSAAIMQPLGDNPIIETLNMIGKNLLFIFAALASVGLMFFLTLTVIITASNIAVMIR